MTDSIELLIAIGSDASLRYALPCDLKGALDQAGGSVELKMAVMTGDGVPLRVELKLEQTMQVMEIHAPGHGDDDDEGECDPPKPERREPDKSPSRPPAKKPKPGK